MILQLPTQEAGTGDLRVTCDLLNLLFATDELTDEMDGATVEKIVNDIVNSVRFVPQGLSTSKPPLIAPLL